MTRRWAARAMTFSFVLATAGACGDEAAPVSFPPVTNAASAAGLPGTVEALPSVDAEGFDELLTSLRGTPVLVNFWASWCTPCEREAPVLTRAHARMGDRVQFLGVDMQDAREGALRFLSRHDIRYPSVFDPSNTIGVRHGLFAPPLTIIYDARGEPTTTIWGEVSPADLDRALAEVLAEVKDGS